MDLIENNYLTKDGLKKEQVLSKEIIIVAEYVEQQIN